MKKWNFLLFVVLTIVVCQATRCVAATESTTCTFRVATVDVTKVVAGSAQINNLKQEQNKKISDLNTFVSDAKANLAKETNDAKRKTLEDSYNKELNDKRDAIVKEYSQKLLSIEKDTLKVIGIKAKKMGYDLVLTKSDVLYGATDITSDVLKDIK